MLLCFLFKGLTHEEAARLIANSYADRSVPELKLLMSPSTFRPNANYQPENWWWNFFPIRSNTPDEIRFCQNSYRHRVFYFYSQEGKSQVSVFFLFFFLSLWFYCLTPDVNFIVNDLISTLSFIQVLFLKTKYLFKELNNNNKKYTCFLFILPLETVLVH